MAGGTCPLFFISGLSRPERRKRPGAGLCRSIARLIPEKIRPTASIGPSAATQPYEHAAEGRMTLTGKKKTALAAIALALNGSSALTATAAARPAAVRQCVGDEALRQDIERFTSELYRTAYPEAVAPGFAVAIIRRDC